jgi:hypothetical protein
MKKSVFPSRMCAMAFIEQIRAMFPSANVLLIDNHIVAWSK